MPPIVPAELAFAGDGTPHAPAYGDIYHSSHGGLEQARHVFLAGNDLPARWAGCARFVILETGFGLGLNFLATWQAWRAAGTTGRLHYVAVEKHPFRRADLATLHARWPELAPLAARLHAQWPPLLPGLHRLEFDNVILTLGLGDAAELLPQLALAADALYLDGFAPERNPELWSDAIVAQLRRLAAPGATLATWTVAGEVRRRLASADFLLERRPGFGNKREMLAGHLPGAASRAQGAIRRRIAVVGAGIAGTTVAHALAARGHDIVVVEAAAEAGAGASGNLAGAFRPLPSLDDGRLSRLLRAGFLLGRRHFAQLPDVIAGWTGVLHVARDARHEDIQRRIVAAHALPEAFCRFVEQDEAAHLAGWPVALGGWWFPQGGWINPPSLCRALLAGIDCHFGFRVTRLDRDHRGWRLTGAEDVIAADDVVLANGIGAAALAPGYPLPIHAGRGAVSYLPEDATPRFDIVVTRLGYVTPPIAGLRCTGATMLVAETAETADAAGATPDLADHAENLHRLNMALPGYGKELDPARLDGRVAFRPMSPDRLPIVGPLAAGDGPWLCNGFGSRGLVFAQVCAELLASQIDGEPLPLERDLVDAVAPERFRHRAKGLQQM